MINMTKHFITLLSVITLLIGSCNNPSEPGSKEIEIFAFNDFHGAITEDYHQTGALKFFSYLKREQQRENVLTLDQGDTWQGSIYSNFNHGELLNDLMCEAKISARTVGNHDFDWGIGYVKANTARTYNGYKIPTLAANVYDYNFETKTIGNVQQYDIGTPTHTYTLANGLKVGIVGVIGEKQITSITSSYVQDIAFKDHISVIKEEATKLRQEGCDVVIAAAHADQDDLKGNNLKNYVDLVLCGHSHQQESFKEGDLYYYQAYAYGGSLNHIYLNYNNGKVTVNTRKTVQMSSDNISTALNGYIDEEIDKIIKRYNEECDEYANVTMAKQTQGYFDSNMELPNLMCRAIYDETKANGYDINFSFTNEARTDLLKNNWKYSDIYEAFPFDNDIYLVEITGKEIRDEVCNWNNVYVPDDGNRTFNLNDKYLVAIIDFLVFHTNKNRNYDFFPDNNGAYVGKLNKNYREILRDWLISNKYPEEGILKAEDFDSNVYNHQKEFNFINE